MCLAGNGNLPSLPSSERNKTFLIIKYLEAFMYNESIFEPSEKTLYCVRPKLRHFQNLSLSASTAGTCLVTVELQWYCFSLQAEGKNAEEQWWKDRWAFLISWDQQKTHWCHLSAKLWLEDLWPSWNSLWQRLFFSSFINLRLAKKIPVATTEV